MLEVIPSGKILGATVAGLDLAQPLKDADFASVRNALGAHGVLRFPKQALTAQQLVEFSARFGKLEINVANSYQEPGLPQIMILSNMVENGKPIGIVSTRNALDPELEEFVSEAERRKHIA